MSSQAIKWSGLEPYLFSNLLFDALFRSCFQQVSFTVVCYCCGLLWLHYNGQVSYLQNKSSYYNAHVKLVKMNCINEADTYLNWDNKSLVCHMITYLNGLIKSRRTRRQQQLFFKQNTNLFL